MSKKITIIGINYYPEDSAIGLYTTQKAEYLIEKGFEVTVITGFPYYPQWEIRDDYKSKPYFYKENINGVKILRSKQYVPKDPTFIKRILHLISFTFGNFINLFRVDKPDVVIAIIPFTTSALLGWILKLVYKSKLWVHIQDFEFDAAIDSGLLSGNKKLIIKALQKIEKSILNKPDIISTISHGMITKLKEKTPVSTYYLTNWIQLSDFSNVSVLPHPHLNSKNFKILYSGNIGVKQDWDFFYNVLKALEVYKNIDVVIVGEGAEKEMVLNKIAPFKFVKHFKLVPYKELSSLLTSADLHVLFQKSDVIDTVMPSKLLGMMASGKPSIVTGNLDSEIAKVFFDSNGGYYFDGKSVQQVLDQIHILQKNKSLRDSLGRDARQYVTTHYSKKQVLDQFILELEKH